MSSSPIEFVVRRADWPEDAEAIRQLREIVFVHEQNVPAEREWDGLDADCTHAVAESGAGEVIGTGRLQSDGHIGRVAVSRPWRSRGVGRALMRALVELAKEQGNATVILNSQTSAIPFYETLGFHAVGEVFLDAGILHREMHKEL